MARQQGRSNKRENHNRDIDEKQNFGKAEFGGEFYFCWNASKSKK